MARLLVERETIYQDEVDMIMDGMDATDIIKIMEARDETYRENPFAKMTETMIKEDESVNNENAENSQENPTETVENTTKEND